MDTLYLDHAATTPLRDEVREAMRPFLSDRFGNPSSTHAVGRSAAAALEGAREEVAEALGAAPREILFVRGGTESDNLAVLGRADAIRRDGRTPHPVVSAVEHHAVLESAGAAAEDGGRLHVIPVLPSGDPDWDALDEALADAGEDAVASFMWVNNEVGLRLPVERVAQRVRAAGGTLHTDAVQAVGKLPVRVDEIGVDLLSLTGHKIYGPKGSGVLYVRRGTDLRARLFGGGQERALRPGTQDVAGAVGVARAVTLAVKERPDEARRLEALRDRLERGLLDALSDLRVHGAEGSRAPHVTNLGVPGADLDALLVGLDLEGVAVSSGSACSSGANRQSHVVEALYGDEATDTVPLRFSLGRSTGEDDVDRAIEATVRVVERVRRARAPA